VGEEENAQEEESIFKRGEKKFPGRTYQEGPFTTNLGLYIFDFLEAKKKVAV
jgi:hypothetical protein